MAHPEPIHLWKITPVADPEDPAWQGRRIWREIVVVAPTSGQALLAASRHAADRMGLETEDSQDGQQVRPGISDAKLYRVDRLDDPPPAGVDSGAVIQAFMAAPPSVVDPPLSS